MTLSLTVKEWVDHKRESSGLLGLSKQIAQQMLRTLSPYGRTDLTQHVNLLGASTIPYLQRDAGDALVAAIKAHGKKLKLRHALRVLPQQYAAFQWHQMGCRVAVADTPGASAHEMGIAIDVIESEEWVKILREHNWHPRHADEGHFNFHGASDPDFARYGIRAFQQLWNVHNLRAPSETKGLETNGVCCARTLAKMEMSPAAGW